MAGVEYPGTQRLTSLLVVLAYAVSMSSVLAESRKEIEHRLKDQYEGSVLTLRKPYSGKRLKFTWDGNLVSSGSPGSWTVCGLVEVRSLSLKRDRLEVRGVRRIATYDENQKKLTQDRLGASIQITIELSSSSIDENSIGMSLARTFLKKDEALADVVPSYWSSYLVGTVKQQTDSEVAGTGGAASVGTGPDGRVAVVEGVLNVGNWVSPPKIIQMPQPSYTEDARKAKFQGTVVLSLIVQRDGTARDIEIKKPLGFGLDEEAVEALKKWIFQPGEKGGTPVEVRAEVEVSFKLL